MNHNKGRGTRRQNERMREFRQGSEGRCCVRREGGEEEEGWSKGSAISRS